MNDLFQIKGQKVLITGCASGIGQALAVGFACQGAHIIGVYHKSSPNDLKKELEQLKASYYLHQVDLSSIKECEDFCHFLKKEYVYVDTLINNAGINLRNQALHYTMDDWEKMLQVNLTTPMLLSKFVSGLAISNKKTSSIIHILSLCAIRGGMNTTGYTATKHGLAGLMKLQANEWGPHGIRVNAIVPGFIQTAMTHQFLNCRELSDPVLNRISLKRWGNPEDLVGTAVFLSSKAAAYIHGEMITVDGGYSCS